VNSFKNLPGNILPFVLTIKSGKMKNLHFRAVKLLFNLLTSQMPFSLIAQFDSLPNFRYYDKQGVNVFESPKQPVNDYNGFKIRTGAGITQQFQSLSHENSTDGKGSNELYAISPGFTTPMANISFDIQLAKGIRLNLASYLSSRYQNGVRIKGAYLQFDKLPFKGEGWDKLMEVVTIKLGHMEINYGDAHFRRSDGGLAIYNPFIENYILDAYTTETGGEIYARKKAFFAMAGISNGRAQGNFDSLIAPKQDGNISKSPSIYIKSGIDKSWDKWFRIRLSCSFYHNASSGGNALYAGDRAGSNYFMVMEKDGPAVPYANNDFSGRINPGFNKKVDAFQVNGFFKLIGLELFATYEAARGSNTKESTIRHIQQLAFDWVFRFGDNENIFIASRYNEVTALLPGFTNNVKIDRVCMSAGYFFTRNILLKGELVDQYYRDFPEKDHRRDGKFMGFVIQAVIGF
jgi:hypothetical protein